MSINVFGPPTRQEKEEMALYMYHEGKTYREIAKECHLSFGDISRLIKAESGELEHDATEKVQSKVSKETQAIKLFNEGRCPVEVAIELDITTDDVLVIHQKYQRLRNLESFNSAFEQVKGNIGPYMQLFNLMNGLGMTPEHVAELVKYGNSLPQLQNSHLTLRNEIYDLQSQKQNLGNKLNLMWKEVEDYTKALQYLTNEIEKRNKELVALNNEIDAKQKFIKNLTMTRAMSE
jgi:DNA repair ATPase RecN